jgi:hypothetical protein
MKIKITMDVPEEYADRDHPTGLKNDAYEALMDALMDHGDDVTIEAAE